MTIERLEQENRWLKRAVAALVLVGASIVWMGQSDGPRTIRARQLVLEDMNGKARVTLAISPSGEVKLVSTDREAQAVTVDVNDAARFLASSWPGR